MRSDTGRRSERLQIHRWRSRATLIGFLSILPFLSSLAEEIRLGEIQLPALRIDGQLARAHTQGLEIISTNFYVSARREDVATKRAFLFRTSTNRTDWDAWDITPRDAGGEITKLDHPGGMQSDGARLWIPVAESKRHGESLIRAFSLTALVPGQRLKADIEFPVHDHIGALAVFADRKTIIGASWDTETVYLWDFGGHLQRTLSEPELNKWSLGVSDKPNRGTGLAVQDWKARGAWLFASGLIKGRDASTEGPKSRLIWFLPFAERPREPFSVTLPTHNGIEMAREAMATYDGRAIFLPEDLGATNRMFQFPGRNSEPQAHTR